MSTFKKVRLELVLPVVFAWFFMSVLVDIITIPTVFRNSSSIVDAGKIGMTVFGRFNIFEIIFALVVISGAWVKYRDLKHKIWMFLAIPLVALSLIYKFYMTPMITNTTYEIHQTQTSDPQYAVLQEKHAFYHNSYRKLEYVKLLLLLGLGGAVLVNRVRNNKEIA